MSPANTLFVVACAALLGVAYGAGCSSASIGKPYVTDLIINLDTVVIPRGQRNATIDIPDNCQPLGKRLVAENANACDYISAPDISLGPAFSPLYVRRTNSLDDVALVNIQQACRPGNN